MKIPEKNRLRERKGEYKRKKANPEFGVELAFVC